MKLQFDDDGDGWIVLTIILVVVAGAVLVAWLT